DPTSGDYVNALKTLNTELGTTPSQWDWVINAFKLARQYFDCDTKLIINEYGIENNTSLMNSYVAIINALKAENLIDGVGIQAHSFSTQRYGSVPANQTIAQAYSDHSQFLLNNLNLLASTGLPIQVTELDIDGNVSLDA
ncbi:MAG TPA: endo-1,4-beta-xylanase, partial [Saprospiraceae bacterium]|nr:endo-1,4-beta-xylanase [Saprospiraceae bacterium]